MKKRLLALFCFSLFIASSSYAAYYYKGDQLARRNPWFVAVGGGYAWSNESGVSNPDPDFWDSSTQGYNANLGNSPFWSLGIGKQVWDYINFDISYTDYDTFHYQKYQTASDATTPGFLRARTRYFDLNNQSLLVNVTLHPRSHQLSFNCDQFSIFPFISAGIGAGFNRVNNFYTVGNVSGVGSTSSIGEEDVTHTAFAWQGSAGLTIMAVNSYLAVDIGYRYYDGGDFNGPDTIMVNNSPDTGNVISAPAWSGRLTTNQAFVNFRFLV
jgi:opacity protein-like surface antigen